MKRKLIQHGMSSLTVSLPRKWVIENSLKKGEEVDVDVSEGKVTIGAKKSYGKRSIDVDISGASPMIRRIIGACFKAGYDEINIRFSSFEELKAVQELVRDQFTGFEIISQSKNNLKVKNLSLASFEELEHTLKRFFFVAENMASEIAGAIEKKDSEWLKTASLQKIESDKLADYCRRGINMGAETGGKRAAPLYTVIEQTEKVVDRYRDLCIILGKQMPAKETSAIIQDVMGFQKHFRELFYNFSIKGVAALGKKKEILQKRIDSAYLKKKDIRAVALADRILNLVFDLNGPLMAAYV